MSGPPSTPGVFTEGNNAFPNSIQKFPSSTPAFLGYTEKAIQNERNLQHQAVHIHSFNEYLLLFGGAPESTFNIRATDSDPGFVLSASSAPHLLYHSIKFFFANGGGDCYIISVGDYDASLDMADFLGDLSDETPRGLRVLSTVQEPSLIVIPDAVLFERKDCSEIQKAMLRLCAEEKKFAILDVQHGHLDKSVQSSEKDIIQLFREGIGGDNLSHGAAYYPWLETVVTSQSDVSFKNIDKGSIHDLIELLQKSVTDTAIQTEIAKLSQNDVDEKTLHNVLLASVPTYKDIISSIRKKINLLPPSGAMAGIYAMIDNDLGIHQSPANVGISSVNAPSILINDNQQEDLNVPLDGKAVNAIRLFPGKGTLVWGARTLDGNSADWRYISVRRLITMVEQSIKLALRAFVFEPNDANTWRTVKAMVENFLRNLWSEGALVGATPEESFSVDIGLGTSMTSEDILNGIMRCRISLAATRPAEFIIISCEQEMAQA